MKIVTRKFNQMHVLAMCFQRIWKSNESIFCNPYSRISETLECQKLTLSLGLFKL